MQQVGLDRVGRVGGALFVLLFLADIFITPGEPDPDGGAGSIARYYVEHGRAVEQVSLLHAAGGVCFLLFLGALVTRSPWRRLPMVARTAGFAGVAAGALGLVSYATAGAAAYLAAHGADAQTVRAVAEIRYVCSSYAGVGLALLLGAAALVPEAPRWLRWAGAATAVLLLAGVAGTYAIGGLLDLAGFAGSLLFALWVLVTCLVGRRAAEQREGSPDAIPAAIG